MSLKKKYLETKPECKVTFKINKDLANSCDQVNLVGEFNQWNTAHTPMKKLKNGDFSITINLEKGKEYQFKYHLAEENAWVNEVEADKYVPNEFQGENSVIVV